MKKCIRCQQEKELVCFSIKNKDKSTYQSWCKVCQKAYKDQHYIDNKESYIRKAGKRNKQVKQWVQRLKEVPCMDCSIQYPYYVMEFDHREDKLFGIGSNGSARFAKATLLAEIAKCDIVCSNCHRERTHKRNTLP